MGLISGLVTGLVTWPLAPVRGVVWVAEQVEQEAQRQWHDPAVIHRQLDEITERERSGELSSDEAAALEEALVQRILDAAAGHG